MGIVPWTDSSAAKGICARLGRGKVRHLQGEVLVGTGPREVRHGQDEKVGWEQNRADTDQGVGAAETLGAPRAPALAEASLDRALGVVRCDPAGVDMSTHHAVLRAMGLGIVDIVKGMTVLATCPPG